MLEAQTTLVLRHLRTHGSITALEAASRYGILRLAARVEELRRAGHRIQTCMVHRGGKRFARYGLV